ncbi:MAG: hypothetical protein WA765_00710 [Candidatus Acidiferrum sp.]
MLATRSLAKTPLARPRQGAEKKASPLRWDPPRVDAPILTLSPAPSCSLPDVLNQAGQRAEELVDHLQKFVAHEQIRYQQTDRQGLPEISLAPKFDYLVDFGKTFEPLQIHETRTPLERTQNQPLSSILDKGLPVLALIFHPALQGDYEMRCEGATQWNRQPAWVVHFRQRKGKRPRTITMETPVEVYPRVVNATELRPLSIKGRAWIAADSGQIMHLETNLVGPILMIDLSEIAISVDYAPVKSHSLNVEIWLPHYIVGYTDYAQRRMIIEHTFSDFQLFSIETRETIQKPYVPQPNH